MAEEIPISDIRPIRIKYDKLIASLRKMLEEIWRKFKLQIWDVYCKNIKIRCKNKKNGGGDWNLRYKTYTDKIGQIKGNLQENGRYKDKKYIQIK